MSVPQSVPPNDPAAHALLRAAYDGTYRFPTGFAGFVAAVRFAQDETTASGALRVRSPREIEVEIPADEATVGWVARELGSVAGHRWPTPYAESDGRWTLTLGPEDRHPLGRLVRFHDDPFDSSYRVRDGRITQINRRMGPVRFSITLQAHVQTDDGRVLPTAFSVVHWDTVQGRLNRADTYCDRYAPVDGVYLPVSRRVVTADDAGVTAREMALIDHALLPANVAAVGGERTGLRAGSVTGGGHPAS